LFAAACLSRNISEYERDKIRSSSSQPTIPYAHLDDDDEMDEKDHAKLNKTIDTAWKNYKSGGKTYTAEEVIAQLRAKE